MIVSSISLKELENIKVSGNKDADIKYAARKILRLLDENPKSFKTYIYKPKMLEALVYHYHLPETDDMRILASALDFHVNKVVPADDFKFITNDLSLKQIASIVFPDSFIKSLKTNDDSYTGYIEVQMNDEEMDYFYSHLDENIYDCLIN